MKTKQKLMLALIMMIILVQSACSGNATGSCPSPTSATKLFTNEEYGYCLLYPVEYSTSMPNYIVINPISAAGDAIGDAWLNIAVAPASGHTAAQIADELIAAPGEGFNITRFDAQVGGEAAVVVDGLPGQDSGRHVFIVHDDRLYDLIFMPWYPNPTAPTPLEDLYTMTVDTFHFMPQK